MGLCSLHFGCIKRKRV